MLNLDKLNSQLDLSNFDVSQLKTLLSEQQKIVSIILLVGAFLIAVMMFNDYRSKDRVLRLQISQEQGKLGVIKTRAGVLKDIDDFKSSMPKAINQFDLITRISGVGNQNHVTIESLSPPETKQVALYDALTFRFTAVADNFKDMMLFVRKIEKSKPPMRIDVWNAREAEDGKVSAETLISSVSIHS